MEVKKVKKVILSILAVSSLAAYKILNVKVGPCSPEMEAKINK